MSSKILHPPGGLPHAAPLNTPAANQKSRATPRSNVRRRTTDEPSIQGSAAEAGQAHGFDDGEHFEGHKRDARPDVPQGSGSVGRSGTKPQGALALPQPMTGAAAKLQRSETTGEGRRPEHGHWARLIAQASPERLAQGQAVLRQHQTALEAFSRLVPGLGKGR